MLSVVDGVEQLQTFFGQYLPQLFISAAAPFAIFAFIAVVGPAGGHASCSPRRSSRSSCPGSRTGSNREASIARQKAFKSFGEEFLDAMQGLPTLKAFGQGRAYGRRLAEKARTLSDEHHVGARRERHDARHHGCGDCRSAPPPRSRSAPGACRTGEMSLEALLIVLMAGTEIFRPLRDLRTVLHQGMNGQSAAQGVHALLDAAESAPAGSATVSAETRRRPSIAFEGVRFAYPGVRGAALEDLTFAVAPGERVGIVGPSGAGKSSIVRLLLRLHDPQQGSVRIGDQDLRGLDPGGSAAAHRRRRAGHLSLLRHGRGEPAPGPSGRDRGRAARRRRGRRTRTSSSRRCPTATAPSSASAGRGSPAASASASRSRARCCVDAPILILDEALSSVDAENEAVIQEALDRLMQGRTTLILAHRLSSVIGADRILVLEHGRVVESGRHAELMRRDGPYRRLMASQAEGAAGSDHDAVASGARHPRAPCGGRRRRGRHARGHRRARHQRRCRRAWAGARRSPRSTRFIRPWRGQLAVDDRPAASRGWPPSSASACSARWRSPASRAAAFRRRSSSRCSSSRRSPGCCTGSNPGSRTTWPTACSPRCASSSSPSSKRSRPPISVERRSGDLVALATQDVETVEYFFAHTVAPAFVAVLVPCAVLAWLGAHRRGRSRSRCCRFSPTPALAVPAAAARGRAGLARARARWASSARTSPRRSRACPSCSLSAPAAAGARRSWRSCGATSSCGSRCSTISRARSERLELATGLGGLAIALARRAARGGRRGSTRRSCRSSS